MTATHESLATRASVIATQDHARLDELELAMLARAEPVEMPVTHRFTPGLYAREIFMPAGTLLTSKIHNTEHPYVVISGRVSVYIPGVGTQHIEAGHVGITQPGTRRVLYIHEDCRWITFHPLAAHEDSDEARTLDDEARVAMVEARIIERRELPDGTTTHEMYLEALQALELDGEDSVSVPVPAHQYEYGGAP